MSYRFVFLLTALALAGCRRTQQAEFQRIAVPAFENLSGDPALEWMAFAFAEVAAAAIAGHPRAHPLRIEHSSAAAAVRATHILHGSFRRSADRLLAEAVLEDLRTLKTAGHATASGAFSQGPAPVADRLLAALELRARPVAQRQAAALRLYVEASSASDRMPALRQALALDAGFGAAWVALAQAHLARRDLSGAHRALEEALRSHALDPVDRARLTLMRAALGGRQAEYLQALEGLARLTPADPEVFQALAIRQRARHDRAASVRAFQEALRRDPENPFLLNEAGYAFADAGDASAAVAVLERYRRLQPAEPNPPDSLGDVYFQFGRFADAESSYLEADARRPGFAAGASRLKAAYCRFMQGDLNGGDALFGKFLDARGKAGDRWLEFRRAEWDYLTGRRRRAFERLAAWAAAADRLPDERVIALTRLAIWSLDCGDRPEARRFAQLAAVANGGPQSRLLARLCLWLTQPEGSAEQWSQRARAALDERFPPGIRSAALAYALLLSKHFREAAALLRELVRQTPPSPGEPMPVLLAWALLESGQDPGDLLARWPLPRVEIEQPLPALVFPRVIFLRALWLDKQGRRQEARPLYSLFLKYAGDRPSTFAERERAEAALRR